MQETGRLPSWIRGALDEPVEDGILRLYAILDGARDGQIAAKIRASGVEARCLFDGELQPVLAAAAPYLVALDPAAPLLRTLIAEGSGNAWGVFLTSTAPIDALRRHLRRLLRVVDEDGRQLMFRFYDPRVLRVYLPTCTIAELEFVFGPVTAFHVEDDGVPAGITSFRAPRRPHSAQPREPTSTDSVGPSGDSTAR